MMQGLLGCLESSFECHAGMNGGLMCCDCLMPKLVVVFGCFCLMAMHVVRIELVWSRCVSELMLLF